MVKDSITPSAASRILYSEDDALIRELVGRFLRRSGYDVVTCEDGAVALETFLAAPTSFQILFTDHEMPKLNGLALVRRLRAEGFMGPVLVNSGSQTPSIQKEYEEQGVKHFIPKPALPGDLLRAFRSLP